MAIINPTSSFDATKIRQGARWAATISSRLFPLTLVATSNQIEKHAPSDLGGSVLKLWRIKQFGAEQTGKPQQKSSERVEQNKTKQAVTMKEPRLYLPMPRPPWEMGRTEGTNITAPRMYKKTILSFPGLRLREPKVF